MNSFKEFQKMFLESDKEQRAKYRKFVMGDRDCTSEDLPGRNHNKKRDLGVSYDFIVIDEMNFPINQVRKENRFVKLCEKIVF